MASDGKNELNDERCSGTVIRTQQTAIEFGWIASPSTSASASLFRTNSICAIFLYLLLPISSAFQPRHLTGINFCMACPSCG